MGSDKAELVLGGRTLLERAVNALSAVSGEVLLATGERERYAELGCRIVLDRYSDAGPLAGLEAGLSAAASSAPEAGAFVAVLPCDMPRIDARMFGALLARARAEAGVAACLVKSSTGPEPLCGVYHTRALFAIRAALDAGERKVLSFLRCAAADGRMPRVVWVEDRELTAELGFPVSTANVNTPADLAALQGAKESA